MIEITGDLFDLFGGDVYDAIVIPVNSTIDARGDLVMGAGVALGAKERWPWLPTASALRVDYSVYTFRIPDQEKFIVHFRTKRNWRDGSTSHMIRESAAALSKWADHRHEDVRRIVLPRVGCGLGGLPWLEVKKILGAFLDNRFHVTEGPK
jgi:O-acetyl-ADP-ribose deacetylase (regulator of RNase III)